MPGTAPVLVLRRATEEDAGRVAALWTGASRWLAAGGTGQWQWPVNTGRIRDDIALGAVWIGSCGGVDAATITITTDGDPGFWPASSETDTAVYVSRLVAARAFAGAQFGAALLDWAGRQAHAAGREWVRTDAWSTNPALLAYYRSQGFTHVRTIRQSARYEAACLQRPSDYQRPGLPAATIGDAGNQGNPHDRSEV